MKTRCSLSVMLSLRALIHLSTPPRPGTPAANMSNLVREDVAQSAPITGDSKRSLAEQYFDFNKDAIGKIMPVLV